MEPDTLNNVSEWIKEKAKLWGVPEEMLAERAALALNHKKEMTDLCGIDPETQMWHFEDYFRDLLPVDEDSKSVSFDPLEAAAKTEAKALLEKKAKRTVHDLLRQKLGMNTVEWTHGRKR